MPKILFVCTGNICRSPMAEGLLKKMRSDFSVSSAGVSSMDGWNATPEAIDVMMERGIDISGHSARQVTGEMVNDADLVLTMTERHKKLLTTDYPEAEAKIFTLKEFAGTGIDIEDPYFTSKEFYEMIAREIAEALKEADFGDLE
jgi:protein-tyrosine-phosphatase